MGGSTEGEVNGLENPQNDTINTQSGSQSVSVGEKKGVSTSEWTNCRGVDQEVGDTMRMGFHLIEFCL